MKRIYEREEEGVTYYYDLARIYRVMIQPASAGKPDYSFGIVTFENGITEQLTRNVVLEIKDAWVAYIEGSAQ